MKTLVKLANQRTYAPVLNTVLVKDGRAYATDMDMVISYPCDRWPGCYRADALKVGQYLDAEQTASDWPELLTMPAKGVRELTVWTNNLAWVSRAMSDEETRYYLRGVYFDGDTMAGCDGHRLHVAGEPVYSGSGIIVPAMAIEYALACAKEQKTDKINIILSPSRCLIQVGDYEIITKTIDGTFPDYLRVIPNHENSAPFYGIELTGACKEAIKAARAVKDKVQKVKLNGGSLSWAYDDLKGQVAIQTALDIEIGLNASLLADIGLDGVIEYGSNRDPIAVRADNRLAVLMPLRL